MAGMNEKWLPVGATFLVVVIVSGTAAFNNALTNSAPMPPPTQVPEPTWTPEPTPVPYKMTASQMDSLQTEADEARVKRAALPTVPPMSPSASESTTPVVDQRSDDEIVEALIHDLGNRILSSNTTSDLQMVEANIGEMQEGVEAARPSGIDQSRWPDIARNVRLTWALGGLLRACDLRMNYLTTGSSFTDEGCRGVIQDTEAEVHPQTLEEGQKIFEDVGKYQREDTWKPGPAPRVAEDTFSFTVSPTPDQN